MSEKASSLERGAAPSQAKDKPTMEHEEYYKHKSGYSHGIAAIAEVSSSGSLDFWLAMAPSMLGLSLVGMTGPWGREAEAREAASTWRT